MSRAGRRGSAGCHRGAEWCRVALRVAIQRLKNPLSGGNAKTPQLIALSTPAKQSSTTYHFINLSSLCKPPPPPPPSPSALPSLHPHSAPANLPEISDEHSPPSTSTLLPNLAQAHSPFSAVSKTLILPLVLSLALPPPFLAPSADYTQLNHLSSLPQTSQSTAPHARRTS